MDITFLKRWRKKAEKTYPEERFGKRTKRLRREFVLDQLYIYKGLDRTFMKY